MTYVCTLPMHLLNKYCDCACVDLLGALIDMAK